MLVSINLLKNSIHISMDNLMVALELPTPAPLAGGDAEPCLGATLCPVKADHRRRLGTFTQTSGILVDQSPPGHLWRDTWTALSGPLSNQIARSDRPDYAFEPAHFVSNFKTEGVLTPKTLKKTLFRRKCLESRFAEVNSRTNSSTNPLLLLL